MTIQTNVIENKVHVFLFTVLLDKVFSIKTLKVFMIHVKAILVGVDHIRISVLGLN